MSGDYEYIEVAVNDGIAELTFNRPAQRNALHLPMNLEIRQALESLAARDDVCALILKGAGGRAFVSGADIAELRARKGPVALGQHNAKLCDAIESFPYPTIAAIQGFALGGGCEIALACDLRVGGQSARLGQPEVGLGILPAAGGTWRLQRIVGLAKAKELIFTGRIINADEAHNIGLLNHVVGDDEVLAKARALAQEIKTQGRYAVRLAKLVIDRGREVSREAGLALEALAQTVLYDDEDKDLRMGRFLEKRAQRRAERAQAAQAEDQEKSE